MTAVSTPCKKICTLHPALKGCVGCFRSREEIATWLRLSEAERLAIMAELPAREADFRARIAARKAAKAAQSSSG